MSVQTIRKALGELQDDPDNETAWSDLRGALDDVSGEEVAKFFAAARQAHLQRREYGAVANLLEIASEFAKDTDAEPTVLAELARVCDEELFDDDRAEKVYKRILELRPNDPAAEGALERAQGKREKWEELVNRYVDEAKGSEENAFRASLLVSAAEVAYRYGRPQTSGKKKLAQLMSEITTGLTEALEIDPKNRRASALLEHIYRQTSRWEELTHVLERMGNELPAKDEKLAAWLRLARLLNKKLKSPERASAAYAQVLDLQPGNAEATSALVDFFTQKEMWDHLVSLYDEQLAVAQRSGQTDIGTILQIAMVHWRMRGKPDAAEPYFEKLRRVEPAHPGMLEFFRQQLKEKGDSTRLAQILTDAARALPEGSQRAGIAAEIAQLAEEGANATKAIEQWRAILRQDPTNKNARESLKRLYKQTAGWNALADLLRTELEKTPADDIESRLSILREIAGIYRDQIKSDSALVTVLSQIVQLASDDIDAVRDLVRVYEALQRWRDLLSAQTRLAELEKDTSTKAELFRLVARRWLDQFSNVQNAVDAYEKLHEHAPGDQEAIAKLKELYGKRRTYNKLYELYESEAKGLEEGPQRRELWIEMAKLAAERLDRGADAVKLYKKVIEEDPGAAAALDALEKQAERDKDFASVAEVLERRAAHAPDDTTRLSVLQKLGAVYSERLKDHAGAMKAWKRVLELQPGHAKALRVLRDTYLATSDFDGLTSLYGDAGDWEGLAEVLSNAADRASDAASKIDLSFRAADVYVTHLEAPERAFRAYERVLSVKPDDERAAKALVPIYEQEEKWTRLPPLYEILLAHADDKIAILRQLMTVVGERLGDKAGAFAYAKRAYELAGAGEDALADLEERAGAANQWPQFVEVLEERVKKSKGDEARALWGKIADTYAHQLGREDDAVAIRKRLVEEDEKDVEAMQGLDALLRASDRREDLRWLFELRVDRAKSDEKVDLLLDWATLEEEVFGEPRKAVDLYRRVLQVVPNHGKARRALARLLQSVGDAEEAANVLEQDRDQHEGAERAQREVELAKMYIGSLNKPVVAFEAAKRALDASPGMKDAIAVMEQLLQVAETRGKAAAVLEGHWATTGEHARRPEVIEVMIGTARSKDDKLSLFKKLADVHEELGAPKLAFDVMARAVEEAASDIELWDRLAVLANKTGRTQAFVDAVARALPEGQPTGLPEAVEIDLCERAATLYEEGLGDVDRARPYLDRILQKDPSNERAFVRLKNILTSLERWTDLEAAYERAIQASGIARQVELLAEIALVAEEITGDRAKAMIYYERLLGIEPTHDHAAKALDALYVGAERWDALAQLLERRLERAIGDEVPALRLRLGTVYEGRLSRPDVALGHLEQVLQAEPGNHKARDLVEKCLEIPQLRAKSAQVLEQVYFQSGANRDLVRILEIRLETAGNEEKVDLLRRIAEIRDERLNEDSAALDAYARLVPLAADDPHARERLLDLGRRLGAHEQVAQVLEAASKVASSPQPKAEILGAVAHIYEDLLDDAARAETTHRAILTIDPDDAQIALPAARALERIHAASGKVAELAEVLEIQVKLEDDEARKRELFGRLGEIRENRLDDPKRAIDAWKSRADADPGDDEALAALDRLYERTQDNRALVEVLRSRERGANDPESRKTFLVRIATVLADRLKEVPDAIAAYRQIQDDFGADRTTLDALARLYETAERWDDLAETLQNALAMAEKEEDQLDLLARLGVVRQTRLKDVPSAIDAYRQALTLQPSHKPSRERLEALLDDADAKREAAAILRPLYEADGEHEKLLRVLEIEIDNEESIDAKLGVLAQAVVVTEQNLSDPLRAFGYAARALKAAVAEADLPQWLERAERLAATADRWAAYVELLREVSGDVMDEGTQVDVLVKIAELARGKLEDPALAKEYYKKALAVRGDEARALAALEELHGSSSEHNELLEILKRRAEAAEDDASRKAILFKQARLCETIDEQRSAIEVYEQILDLAPDDEAFTALERLYAQASRWDDLVAVLERQIGMDNNPAEKKARLHHALGMVLKDRTGEYDRAFDEFAAALDLVNKHEATVEALESILSAAENDTNLQVHVPRAAEMLEPVYLGSLDWKKLLRILDARLKVSQDPDERRQILRRLAKLHEEQAEDYPSALETTAKLLAEDITDEETWSELERLARVAGAERRLAEIYATELGKVSSDEPSTAKLAKRTAELFEAQKDTTRALEFYKRAYAFAPEESAGTFEAIDRLLRELNKPAERVTLYRDALEWRNDPNDRLTTLHTIALLQEAELADDDAAIQTYTEALDVEPSDQHSLEALSRLYARRERWSDLAELLERRADQAALPEDEAPFRLELGNILKDKLKDRTRAVDQYERVVEALPPGSGASTAQAAVKALEELLNDPELKARIVDILRPIYERADAWQQLVVIGEQRLALAQDAGERVGVLKEIARLWEDRGGDRQKAFACIRDAFVMDPEDGETRGELDRLGEATARWDDLATAYQGAIEKIDGPGQRELLSSLAKLHDKRRDDPRKALDAYARLFELDETEIEPVEEMDSLATLLADWTKLADLLVKKADLVHDDAEKAATWRRLGALRHDTLDDDKGAIEAYERALELEPESPSGIDRLIDLYEIKDDATRLVDLYRKRVEICGEGEQDLKYALLVRASERLDKGLNERREAIAMLGEALVVRPGDSDVTSRLDRLYTAEEMWPELLENLRLQANNEADDGKRRAVKKRIGELLLKNLDDPRSALDSFREVLEGGFDADVVGHIRSIGDQHDDLRIDAADALEPVLRSADRHDDLVMVLELRLKAQSEPSDRAKTLRAIAEAAETKLGDTKRAEDALLRALAEEPGDAQLHSDIERIADKNGLEGWENYADALGERAGQIFDAHITADLYVRLGKVAEDRLKDDTKAAKAFGQAAEQSGDSPDILVSLDRVTSRLGDARALAGVLERRIAAEAEAAVQADLHHRLASLQLREFGERSRGLATLRSALERVPDHEPSRTAIEKLLEEGDLFDEAFEALEWVYRTLGRTEDLAKLYEKKVGRATESRERNRARLDLARVLDEQAKDPARAQRVVESAVIDDPQDLDAIIELERLAPVTNGWKDAGDALAKALDQARDLPPQGRSELWVRLAQWRRDKEHDSRASEDAFAKALESDPENLEVIRSLEDLRRAPGRERDLIGTLRQRAKIETDLSTKKDLLKEAKSLAEGTVADAELAEAVLRDLLGEDEGDLWALEELTNLRDKAGKPDEVVTLLLRRAELEADGGEIARLRHRAAKVLGEQIGDSKRAIALYEEIFDAEPNDVEAQKALRELYSKTKKNADLAKLLGRLIEIAESPSARSTLRIDLAKLQESMNQTEDAIATLRQVLDEEPSNQPAVDALSELYEKGGNDEELAELLTSQIREAEGRGDSAGEMALQVRLGEVYEGRLKDAARALSTYEAVLARDSSHKGALEAVARLSEGRGSWERAATALSKLAELSTGSERIELCMRLADARTKLSDSEGVEEALKRALEVEAGNAAVRERLRGLYEKEKNWKGLAELLVGDANLIRDAHAGNGGSETPIVAPPAKSMAPPASIPAPPQHVAQQVQLLRRAADIHLKERKEPSDAVPLLERAADLLPSDRELLLALCDAYTAAGREREATQVLEKIIASFGGRRTKDLALYHHRLAKALTTLGERDQALNQLDMAFKIDPRSIEILKDLGVLAFETNDLDRATKTFKALLLQKLDSGVGITKGEVFYYLGEISAKQGDKTRAVQMLERAIESEPGLAKAKTRLGELKS